MDALIESCAWNCKGNALVMVDDTMARLFWRFEEKLGRNLIPVVQFDISSYTRASVYCYHPHRVVILTSLSFADSLEKVLLIFGDFVQTTIEIHILSNWTGDQKEDDNLLPIHHNVADIHIKYAPLPVHLLQLSSRNIDEQNCVELALLWSPDVWNAFPLRLNDFEESKDIECISDIQVDDIPVEMKQPLRQVAHHLARALIFDLGVDPSSSIYTLGYTSKLVGPTLLSEVENIVNHLSKDTLDDRSTSEVARLSEILRAGLFASSPAKNGTSERTSLEKASLIMIDRTEDLISPVSQANGSSLLHRIFSASSHNSDIDGNRGDTLPLSSPLVNQIASDDSNSIPKVHSDSIFCSEEIGLRTLCEELKFEARKLGLTDIMSNEYDILQEIPTLVTSLQRNFHAQSSYSGNTVLLFASIVVEAMKMNANITEENMATIPPDRQKKYIEERILSHFSSDGRAKYTCEATRDSILSFGSLIDEIAQGAISKPEVDIQHLLLLVIGLLSMCHDENNEETFAVIEAVKGKITTLVLSRLSESELLKLSFIPKHLRTSSLQNRASGMFEKEVLVMEKSSPTTDKREILDIFSPTVKEHVSSVVNLALHTRSEVASMHSFNSSEGLLASLMKALLSTDASKSKMEYSLNHVVNPLTQLAGAALNLFSSFGFSSNAHSQARVADNGTIIVFVLGGISFKEAKQVKDAILEAHSSSKRIVILSNDLVSPNSLFQKIFKTADRRLTPRSDKVQ
jgi:hypothetical protein